jgi:hypothetical protein
VKNRIWIVLLVISLGINIGFLLHWLWPRIVAGRSAGHGPSQLGWHASPMRHGLGLSGPQARLMEGERRRVVAQVRPLQDELRRKRRELFVLLKKQTVSDAELDPILSDISRLQTSIEKIFIRHSLQVRGYFSPAQMHKFEGYLERGLCPNMVPEAACPPGKMSGHPGCGDRHNEKK